MSKSFFVERQEAAAVKHHVLRQYLAVFAGKAGLVTREVLFVDGYAGPGAYQDESPGSPQIVVDAAEALGGKREVRGVFIEHNRRFASELRERLDAAGRPGWRVLAGKAEEHVPDVVDEAGDLPVLLFLDPYGLGPPFRLIVDRLLSRPRPRASGYGMDRKTEIVLNFSRAAMHRLGGFLDLDVAAGRVPKFNIFGEPLKPPKTDKDIQKLERQAATLISDMDGFLGGSWWHDEKRQGGAWDLRVRDGYIERLKQEAPGAWLHWVAPVPDRWDGPPQYDLVLLTQHPDGVWKFNEAVASAFRKLHGRAHAASRAVAEAEGQYSIFEMLGGDAPAPDLNSPCVAKVSRNVTAMLAERRPFKVGARLADVVEGVPWPATPSNVFQALRGLHEAELIGGDRPVSAKVKDYWVTPGPAAPPS